MESRVENGEIINVCKCGKEIRNGLYHAHGLEKCEECENKYKKDLTTEE